MAEKGKAPESQPPPSPSPEGELPARRRRRHWGWGLGLAMAGLGGAAAFLLRGCWHSRLGWPVRYDDEFSYQVCVDCGIKRLFDEKAFHAYGPYSYDLHDLIARERAERMHRIRRHEETLAARPRK